MKSGETSAILKSELELIATSVPTKYHSSFLLPLILLRRMDLGSGIYTITGAKPELFLVHQFIGQHSLDWDRIDEWVPQYRLARPQVQSLRKKLPSTTCIGFTIGTQDSYQQ
jgi:uncharacterized protein (UPF0216 family)